MWFIIDFITYYLTLLGQLVSKWLGTSYDEMTIPIIDSFAKEFKCDDSDITHLHGLNKLKHITILSFNNNYIKKIENLSSCNTLTHLYLNHNKILKMEGFDSLVNLVLLQLTENIIKKIEGLSKCTKLEQLDLYGNEIEEGDLTNNEALIYLDLRKNQLINSNNNLVKLPKTKKLFPLFS